MIRARVPSYAAALRRSPTFDAGLEMRSRSPLALSLFLLVGLLSFVPTASAQRALSQVLDLNRQGMEAYNNLEIEEAQALLQQALQAAQRGGVSGSPLARTYLNLGVVAIGGMGDNGGGLDFMVRALQADPNVQLDPLTSTPDIQTMFTLAQQRARQGGGGTGTGTGAATGGGGSSSGGGGGGSSSGGGAAGDLNHVPVPEQLQQTPVPVYIEVPGSPAHVYLYYRGHGMREFRRVEMDRVGRGYGYEIPCADVFAPEVSYYIVAFARDGSPAGFAGSQSSPMRVAIVTARTQSAPALPGRAPPDTCRETECPPGMAGCGGGGGSSGGGSGGRGRGQPGDACSRDSDCASNNCDDDLCGLSNGGGGGDDPGGNDEPGEQSPGPPFFARVGGMAGLSYITEGQRADRFPCSFEEAESIDCFPIDGFPSLDQSYTDLNRNGMADPGENWDALTPEQRVDSNLYGAALSNGYVPPGTPSCDPDNGSVYDGSPYCFYVESPGLAANFALRVDLGYYILPFLAITAGTRLQPVSGRGPLALLQIYAGLEVQLTPPTDLGFHVHAHVRGGAGQIQVFLGRGGNSPNAPWATSGLGMVDFGVTAGYRFMRNVGLYFQPNVVFGLPSFLFTLDIGAGLELGF
jgi:hypothetical protein